MTVLALAELVTILVLVTMFASLLRSQQRAHARREDLLVNQLLHAAGKAWQPAPETERRERTVEDLELRFTPSPEQLPQ